jgi:immune inhibitor A
MKDNSNKVIGAMLTLLAVLVTAACICSTIWISGAYHLTRRAATTAITTLWPTDSLLRHTPAVLPSQIPETSATTPATAASVASGEPAKPGLADVPSTQALASDGAQNTLKTLENTQVPINDLIDLARRLQGKRDIPRTLAPASAPLQAGAQQSFWLMDTDKKVNFQVRATLAYVTDHLYFWVEDDVSFNKRALQKLADTFDQKIYPTDREFFGSEWSPGIDGDARLHILYARGIGNSIAGYFSSADEYPPQVNQFSNAHEMFVLNADTSRLNAEYTYGVLAHEFQHMIHWYLDRNEETWLNEGFADLAAVVNGYDIGSAPYVFAADPDIQLTYWPPDPDPAHYGAAFLFLTYFLDRFGETATQAVVANSTNGLTSIDQALAEIGARDGISGKPVTADDVFVDWAVTNYLQDGRVSDGRYRYHIYPTAPKLGATEIIKDCPTGPETRQVHQYGADYIRIRCSGDYRLRFNGSREVALLPTQPHSGSYAFWSNQGDESDMTLTHTFDFRRVSGPLWLDYWTWYDLEKGFDQLYLLVSEDGGQSWQILPTPSGGQEDFSGNSFGWAYTGQSGDGSDSVSSSPRWIQEHVNLSQLAGKEVQLRFEYVTDSSVNGEGFVLDDIAIPQIGYATDFDHDDGGWQAQGFARVQNVLPQTYRIALIEKGRPPKVSLYELYGDNTLEIPIQIGDEVSEVILVVSGTTRITRQEAGYEFQLLR